MIRRKISIDNVYNGKWLIFIELKLITIALVFKISYNLNFTCNWRVNMKIYLQKAIFINRAPLDKIELDFSENEISILSAVNGRGKTTILSHIVECIYEMARPNFPSEFKDKENDLYRLSGNMYNLDQSKPSFVYLRFKTLDSEIDYVDIRNNCTEEEYDEAIKIENKIPFSEIKPTLEQFNYIKKTSSNLDKLKVEHLFSNNILTYFPSYRFEMPGYLNDPYKVKLDFNNKSKISGYLTNPIEVVTGLPQLANWIMDIVLDLRAATSSIDQILFRNLNYIITNTLASKNCGQLRFGVGPRGFGSTRIQIYENKGGHNENQVYPSIFNLSSGESSVLCLFGEILRQADNNKNNILLEQVTGIVLVDEIDKHLHIKLQKEVLPELMKIFPNVQFIISSHSPFLSMGLAELLQERSKIIDLDNLGISKDPTTNDQYKEVYNMIIGQNDNFKEMYQSVQEKIKEMETPLIITEGKTDWKHLKNALLKFQTNGEFQNLNIRFDEYEDELGDTRLDSLLRSLARKPNPNKIIGLFDNDEDTGKKYDTPEPISLGNNVYGWCIPNPRQLPYGISIEFLYEDNDIKKKDNQNRRLYLSDEFKEKSLKLKTDSDINSTNKKIIECYRKRIVKIIDSEVFDSNERSIALSKNDFARNILDNVEPFDSVDVKHFKNVFDRIQAICNK